MKKRNRIKELFSPQAATIRFIFVRDRKSIKLYWMNWMGKKNSFIQVFVFSSSCHSRWNLLYKEKVFIFSYFWISLIKLVVDIWQNENTSWPACDITYNWRWQEYSSFEILYWKQRCFGIWIPVIRTIFHRRTSDNTKRSKERRGRK